MLNQKKKPKSPPTCYSFISHGQLDIQGRAHKLKSQRSFFGSFPDLQLFVALTSLVKNNLHTTKSLRFFFFLTVVLF